jgi:phosphate-selective porin OprO/OprP
MIADGSIARAQVPPWGPPAAPAAISVAVLPTTTGVAQVAAGSTAATNSGVFPVPAISTVAAQQPFDAPAQGAITPLPAITSPPMGSDFGFGGLFAADTAPTPSIYPGSAVPIPPLTGTGSFTIGSDRLFSGSWTNDGPVWRTQNGDFTFHPRFINQMDVIAMHSPPPGVTAPGGTGTADSVDFRRLRFGSDGTMWETIDYVFEFDLALALQNYDPASGGTPISGLRPGGTVAGVAQNQAGNTGGVIQPTTVFLVFKDVPLLGNIRPGNQQDWISLEHIESARFLDFMERAPIMDAFNGPNNNGYMPGITTYRTYFDQNLAVQLGVYKNNAYDSGFTYNTGDNNYGAGGRIHCTPYYDEPTNGRYLVHIGCGGEYRGFNTTPFANQDGTNIRIRSRGDLRTTASTLDPNFADTGNFYCTGQGLLCPEMAIVWGPWLFQAEYEESYMVGAQAQKGTGSLGNVAFRGGYAEALYFLTGENRQYQRLSGVFGRVIPNQNAFWTRGAGFSRGAWQVGLRYDWLDLNSGAINGGQNQDMTLGLNWFLNPNARIQLNYVGSWINNAASATYAGTVFSLNGSRFVGEGYIQTVGTRLDFNF